MVYLSPQGRKLDQRLGELARLPELILLAGRYEGIDERLVAEQVDFEVSLGDYVLSGGELGAMVLIDAVSRLIPGVLGDQASAEQDSFSNLGWTVLTTLAPWITTVKRCPRFYAVGTMVELSNGDFDRA